MSEFWTFSFEEEMYRISSKFKILPKFTSDILVIIIKRPIYDSPYRSSVKSKDKVYKSRSILYYSLTESNPEVVPHPVDKIINPFETTTILTLVALSLIYTGMKGKRHCLF